MKTLAPSLSLALLFTLTTVAYGQRDFSNVEITRNSLARK